MSAHLFGQGRGHISRRVQRIARAHGAEAVNYTEPQCICGWGCAPGKCRASKRHWFEITNFGEPHNSDRARKVIAAIGGDA